MPFCFILLVLEVSNLSGLKFLLKLEVKWNKEEVYFKCCLRSWCFWSGQRTQAETDSRVGLGAAQGVCSPPTLHLISSLLPRGVPWNGWNAGRPRPGSSSGPKHINLDLGRSRRALGVHASQEGSKTSVNVVCSWEAILQGPARVTGPGRRLAC